MYSVHVQAWTCTNMHIYIKTMSTGTFLFISSTTLPVLILCCWADCTEFANNRFWTGYVFSFSFYMYLLSSNPMKAPGELGHQSISYCVGFPRNYSEDF